jgi:hypothetical protein
MGTPRIVSAICFGGVAAAVGIALWIVVVGGDPEAAAAPLPFLPARLTTPTGEHIPEGVFPRNDGCLACHVEIAAQWAGSMHAFAQVDPVYRALFQVAHEETDGNTDLFCVGCHSPPAVLSGNGREPWDLGPPASQGISCVVCHTIAGPSQPGQSPANASFVIDPTGPIRGPYGRRCGGTIKETVRSEYLASSAFCAGCHGAEHAQNGLVLERTYEEWQGSVYAERGIQCQDCHMQPVEVAIATARSLKKQLNPGRIAGIERPHVYTHEFLGGNTVLPRLLGAPAHAIATEALLKAAATLELVDLPKRIAPGEEFPVKVKLTNALAGHNLPTSLIHLRQLWLDVRVHDANGSEIYSSGSIDAEGKLDPDAVRYHGTFGDAAGKPVIKPWQATQFLSRRTIPPRGHMIETFDVSLPAEVNGPLRLEVTLRYRPFPQKMLNLALGEDAPSIPITEMTTTSATLEVREDG